MQMMSNIVLNFHPLTLSDVYKKSANSARDEFAFAQALGHLRASFVWLQTKYRSH